MDRRSRSQQRADFSEVSRIILLEEDADDAEDRNREMGKKLDSIRNLNMAILVSLSTGAILFALNLVALVLTR